MKSLYGRFSHVSVQLVTAYNHRFVLHLLVCPALTGTVLGAREPKMKLRAPSLKRHGEINGTNSCRRIMKHGDISSLRQLIPVWEPRNGKLPEEMQWKACVGLWRLPWRCVS